MQAAASSSGHRQAASFPCSLAPQRCLSRLPHLGKP
jgi:hypothetical protein